MTVESTIQFHEIQNLKRRIAELEGKEPHIDMEQSAKKMKIQEKYKKEEEKKQDAPTPDVPSRIQRLTNRERKLQASCHEYEKDKQPKKKEAKKDDEEIPQFKLSSSEEQSTQEDPQNQIESTKEASQPDATNPVLDSPKEQTFMI
ncbi:hypothetical protein L3X38_025870 [Prunus dulcis]|uniref:Uncharacterized protein n=1 Tax=Prunus dulcis TaxID=3755 RepID=A0AAD4Z7T6_PRUDU|nr:hypothetical protein L3X38_025870 [Prunus dulcis]